MKHLAFLFGVVSAAPALADYHNTLLDLEITCNAHGAVVTLSEGTIFYLGKSCDAAREGGGTGRWWFAASAFLIELDDGTYLRVPNEMICDVPYCRP